jgi:hypothetical protein
MCDRKILDLPRQSNHCAVQFGLCRELNPTTLKVQEDEVNVPMSLGWVEVFMECFDGTSIHHSSGGQPSVAGWQCPVYV